MTPGADAPARSVLDREDLTQRRAESWRPPVFVPDSGVRGRTVSVVRRFFDLQAGSLWRDLTTLLAVTQGTLVDVGCGAQPYRSLLDSSVRYIGLDTVMAGEDFGYEMPDVRLIEPDGRWPVEDGEVATVLATETLEHVPDPPAFLAEARRVLAPAGQLILTLPFAARWHYIPNDYWRLTPAALQMILTNAGFDNVAVYARGNERTVACYKVLALLLAAALPQGDSGSMGIRVRTVFLAPLIIVLAALGQLSLRGPSGDDCLGYTVIATRPS
jgi:SAM-dependent methyltransferase